MSDLSIERTPCDHVVQVVGFARRGKNRKAVDLFVRCDECGTAWNLKVPLDRLPDVGSPVVLKLG